MSSADLPTINATEPRSPRDPFARARPTDFHWILLRPVSVLRKTIQPETLAQVATTHERIGNLELYRLQVRLDGEPLQEDGNRLEVLVDHNRQRVRFGPSGVRIAPARRGIAGYLLAQLIDWCQRNVPEYVVTPLILDDQGLSEELQEIRRKLLKRAGFDISFNPDSPARGRAQTSHLQHLIGSWNTERVQPIEPGELLHQLREQEAAQLQQQRQLNTLQASLESYKRNDIGHRFAIGCLIVFSIFQAILLLWVVLR
ncbi:hypothetical protein [Pseudomonas profundi]|uniref:hypothetical protein n=1 Tax=Pseudomonas profundi TaxID=1981513 RepID=UPI00123A33E0|nr:hypothetical protein [Pseudomonas profundi]